MPAISPHYSEELLEKARDYIVNYKKTYDHPIPSHIGLCKILKINKSTIYRWSQEGYEGIQDILDACMDEQQIALIHGGLENTFNSNIVKLALGKHGFHDKQDTTHSGTIGYADLSGDDLDRKIAELEQARANSARQ